MGFVAGNHAATILVPDSGEALGIAGNWAAALGGAVAAGAYGLWGSWQTSQSSWRTSWGALLEPLLYGLLATVIAGACWMLPWSPLMAFISVPIALMVALLPGPVPLLLFAFPCAWVCRLTLSVLGWTLKSQILSYEV